MNICRLTRKKKKGRGVSFKNRAIKYIIIHMKMGNTQRVWDLYVIIFSLNFLAAKRHWIIKLLDSSNLFVFKIS